MVETHVVYVVGGCDSGVLRVHFLVTSEHNGLSIGCDPDNALRE
jgi:hypothetical protein